MSAPTRSQLLEQFGLVSADAYVNLPSQGTIYPTYADGRCVTQVQVRGLTLGEVETLAKGFAASTNSFTPIREVAHKAIIPPLEGWPGGVDNTVFVSNLVEQDILALLSTIRACTFGRDLQGVCSCEACQYTGAITIQVTDIPLNELKATPIEPYTAKFMVQSPKVFANQPVVFKILSIAEIEQLHNRRKAVEAKGVPNELTEGEDRTAAQILSIGNVSDRANIRFLVQKMPADMGQELRQLMQPALDFGLDTDNITAQCPKCDFDKAQVLVPLQRVLFFK